MEETGAIGRVHRIPVKLRCEIMEWGGEFRKKHKEWKERMLEWKLENWFLNLTLSLTGSMNLSKSSSLSTSVSLPIK